MYKIGDRVTVVSSRPRGAEFIPPTWVDDMDEFLGKECVVKDIDSESFLYLGCEGLPERIGETAWWFHSDWVENNSDGNSVPTWEARIYVGSREQYDGPVILQEQLIEHIGHFQKYCTETGSSTVRVTPTCYVFQDYIEHGWEIGLINYPRFPKKIAELNQFARSLAMYLLRKLNQNRVSIVFADRTELLTNENPQEHPAQ